MVYMTQSSSSEELSIINRELSSHRVEVGQRGLTQAVGSGLKVYAVF